MSKIITRMGDGSVVEMTDSELMEDLVKGGEDAAERGRIPMLNKEELQYLFDVFKSPYKFVSVEPGNEVIMTYDGAPIKMTRADVHMSRIQALQTYEKVLGADTLELGHIDYSYKQIKPIVGFEQPLVEQALMVTTAPLIYGAMPNLGLYSQPDGPFPNPSELMPMGKIKEAQESYEAAVEEAVRDIVFVAGEMYESGVDGIILDTVGAAGDADVLASCIATRKLKDKYPDICIEFGMAGEFTLGMHGEMFYEGIRLAGQYAHEQVKVAELAGASLFGSVVNTNTSMSTPWNLARAVVFTKACTEVANIPVHANMGMGVGALTVNDFVPVDILSRCSKAMVELCNLDGL